MKRRRRRTATVPPRRLETGDLPVVGWREWVRLPELGIEAIKVKVDTGARSSALHAYDFDEYTRSGTLWLRFKVHPLQRNTDVEVPARARVIDRRQVKNTSGRPELRWIVQTPIELMAQRYEIELSLTRRDAMGFRMLLGREAVRGRFLVDPGRSFYSDKPKLRR